jgi:hypothetical protein
MSAYCKKIAKFYGLAGGTSFPAPGSNGPAQMLYDNHATYQAAQNSSPVEGSDSWPGGPDPATSKEVE